mmetsp:Transcript_1222/g.3262  ORF Transcript_1222/g.3262 Transcript_1222/m.3262 type:complete len:89 (-) Transcript_1222:272-538(-)
MATSHSMCLDRFRETGDFQSFLSELFFSFPTRNRVQRSQENKQKGSHHGTLLVRLMQYISLPCLSKTENLILVDSQRPSAERGVKRPP